MCPPSLRDLGKSLQVSQWILAFLVCWCPGPGILLGQLRLLVGFRFLDRLLEFKNQERNLDAEEAGATWARRLSPQESWPLAASSGLLWGCWADTKCPSCLTRWALQHGPSAKDRLSPDNRLSHGSLRSPAQQCRAFGGEAGACGEGGQPLGRASCPP